jgi:hypothetical protein
MMNDQKLELTSGDLRKGIDPEESVQLSDFKYDAYMKTTQAAEVTYKAPSGNVQVLKKARA